MTEPPTIEAIGWEVELDGKLIARSTHKTERGDAILRAAEMATDRQHIVTLFFGSERIEVHPE